MKTKNKRGHYIFHACLSDVLMERKGERVCKIYAQSNQWASGWNLDGQAT